jgi:hypothetical protein
MKLLVVEDNPLLQANLLLLLVRLLAQWGYGCAGNHGRQSPRLAEAAEGGLQRGAYSWCLACVP